MAKLVHASPMLVAGGAGFLGSHLCDRLVRMGHRVLCVDNLMTGDLANLEERTRDPGFQFRCHDIADPLPPDELVNGPLRGVFNLACPASPVHYQADPIRTTMTSVRGTYNLLEVARVSGIAMLQASTSEVYGDPTIHPQSECYWGHVNPTGMRACYDEGKRCAESLCFDYQRTHGVDVRVARIFNTYGPRMQIGDGRVVSNFIVQALRNQPLTIYGAGNQTRSFCYVDDLIEGLVRFMSAPRGVRSPMNIGNPDEFTILELAELVLELTGSRSRVTFLPLPSDDPTQRCPDIELARQELGWQPQVKLREGLKKTIAYLDLQLANQNASLPESKPARKRSAAGSGTSPGLSNAHPLPVSQSLSPAGSKAVGVSASGRVGLVGRHVGDARGR